MLKINCIYGFLKAEEKPFFSILSSNLNFATQEHINILLCVSDLMGHQLSESRRFSISLLQSYVPATCTLYSKLEDDTTWEDTLFLLQLPTIEFLEHTECKVKTYFSMEPRIPS